MRLFIEVVELCDRDARSLYQSLDLTDRRLQVPELELSLGLWQGSFRGIERLWLRWMTVEGELIPTDSEKSIVTAERAAIAEERAMIAEERAEQLAARLRALEIDPDDLE